MLVRGTVFNVLGHGVPLLVAVVCLPTVVGGYGTERFGVLALSWTVLGTLATFDFGMGRASARHLGAAISGGTIQDVPRILGTSLLTAAVVGTLSGALLGALAPVLVIDVFGMPAALQAEGAATLRWTGVAIPLLLLSSSLQNALHVAQRFDRASTILIFSVSSHYVVPAVGAMADWTLPTTVSVIVCLKAVALVALWKLIRRHCPGLAGRRMTADWETLRYLARYGSWLAVSSLMMPVLKQSERLLIPALVSVNALTFYSIPYEAMSRAAILPISMAMALFPTFSTRGGADRRVVTDLIVKPVRYLLLLMTPILTFAGVFANELLSTWMGPSFALEAAAPLQLLAAAFYFNAFSTILRSAVQGLGRPDLKAALDIVNAVLFLAALLALTPVLGIRGAATARLMISVVECGGLVMLVSRASKLHLLTIPRALRRDLVLALTFIVGGAATAAPFDDSRYAYVAFACIACSYFYGFWSSLADRTDKLAVAYAMSLFTHPLASARLEQAEGYAHLDTAGGAATQLESLVRHGCEQNAAAVRVVDVPSAVKESAVRE